MERARREKYRMKRERSSQKDRVKKRIVRDEKNNEEGIGMTKEIA